MSKDYKLALPIRTEEDPDNRVQVKLVDMNNPGIGVTIDSDGNIHIELHGNDEAGIDRIVSTNEKGNLSLDGEFDSLVNTNPSSMGLVAHDRLLAHDRTTQNKRLTAKSGDAESVSLDVSLHGANGVEINSSQNKEVWIRDTHDNGGLDAKLNLNDIAPTEGKAGIGRKVGRKYVIMEALDKHVVWGFSSTTQNFDLFKKQLIMVPLGENSQIWFKMTHGTGQVAFGELS